MQKLRWLLPFALFIGAFFVACHEDDFPGLEKTASVTFNGRIIDDLGNPVSGAEVKAGDKSVFTDKNGVFSLEKVVLPADHAAISVNAANFFEFSRAYVVKDGSEQNLTIRLLNKVVKGSINVASGGEVSLGNNAPKLIFPANAVTREDGSAYNGQVVVLGRYLNPQDPELPLYMPGNLTGINLVGEQRSLSTYGMLAVELQDGAGQKLKVASGKEVEIHMPIDASIVSSAPTEVPLWYYDVAKAYWIEEGSAQKVGSEYVGKVKHFTYWNYDGSIPSVKVTGTVYNGDTDHPLSGLQIFIKPTDPANGWGCGHGGSDTDGSFGGQVSKDVLLTISITFFDNTCGNAVLYEQQIGPFSSDAVLPPIILTNIATLNVSGRVVDCSGNPVSHGYAKVTFNNINSFAFGDQDGNFQLNHVICNTANIAGTVTGYDLDQLLESAPSTFTASTSNYNVNAGDLSACATLSEYIRYSLDGGAEVIKLAPVAYEDQALTWMTSLDSTQIGQYINFSFNNSNQTGTFPMQQIIVGSNYSSAIGTLSTTVAQTGNVGDLIIGTFGGDFTDTNGSNHTVSGSYRVIRDQ